MSEVLDLTRELIRRRSLTPDDAGCQEMIARRLQRAHFHCERLRFGEVDNLWARHGRGDPVLVFLGHTDVVPSGPEENWNSPPFEPTIRDGCLYGRGAADMKSGVAAMVVALERFAAEHPDHQGTLALLLTSDEEGPTNLDGVRKIAQHFRKTGQRIDWRVVQGHVAYPEKASNPIHAFAPALSELAAARWDDGNDDFPPTSFQVSNLNAGTGALNVIPGSLVAHFNFRYGSASSEESLRQRTESILRRHGLDHALEWNLSGEPFLSPAGGKLRETVLTICRELCGIEPEQSTGGGTSDGRLIAPLGAEVVELRPVNASIHKVDEHVALADLERLPALYQAICERLLP